MENEKRKLIEEIRHKRWLLTNAVQMTGNFQNDIVLRLSHEIDLLIVRYMRLESLNDYSLEVLTEHTGC